MRHGVSDQCGVGRAMNAVMLLGEIDPYRADGIVRAGLNVGLLIAAMGIPEEPGVIVEVWVALDPPDFPLAHRQGVVLASDGGDIERQEFPRWRPWLARNSRPSRR